MHNYGHALAIAGMFITVCGCSASRVTVDPSNVDSVTLTAREEVRIQLIDKQRIQRLANLLRQGKNVEEHKCMGVGKLIFAMRSGPAMEFEVLLGHSGADMEFRQQSRWSLLSVSRSDFLAIFGLPALDEKHPRGPWPANAGRACTATSQAIGTSP